MDVLLSRLAEQMEANAGPIAIVPIVQAVLEQIVLDPDRVVNNWHPLGFLQLKLGKASGKGSLKLHIWPANIRRTQDPAWLVHRHVWSLRSHILCGEVENSYYNVVSAAKDQATNKLYSVAFSGESSILLETNEFVICTERSRTTYSQGESYAIPISEYHATTAPIDLFASTVVLTPPASRESPDVVGETTGLGTYEYRRVSCEKPLFLEILNRLVACLADGA